jgi:hypothetical protein
MIIKSTIVLTTLSIIPIENNFVLINFQKIPYESLYYIETIPNKNTIEYNTMTMEELIKNNNENISANPQ